MIYELVKRDQAWKAMPWFVLAGVVVSLCPSPVSEFGVVGVVMGLFFLAATPLRATRFYAGLPIGGRDLVLARALSIMAMVWLPALAAAAAAAAFSRPSLAVAGALVVAALCTLAAGLVQSIRVRELAAPKWTQPLFLILTAEASLFLVQYRATALIPASCALAGIALLARTWSVAPKSFELAPAKPRGGDGPARVASPAGVASPRLVWLPVLRSVFTAQYWVMGVFLVFGAFVGQWLALCLCILILWGMARQNTLWLRPLPIRPSALLITMTAPILLALAAGYFGGLHLSWHPKPIPALPVQVLDLGALLAFALAVVLVIELVDWRRLSHISMKVRNSVGAALMLVCFVGGLTGFGLMHGADPLHAAVLRLAQALPSSVGVAMALVAAALAALWWALEKVFAEADSAAKPRAPKDEYSA
ncbi:MAG: hypothetical protein ABSF25_07635 [Bryobacteraceae bacterium]|jgi:nitrogen fixation-related uncharacterized protein